MRFILQRIAVAALVAISHLSLAKTLDAALYGIIALIISLTKAMQLTNFGAVSGYIFKHYNGGPKLGNHNVRTLAVQYGSLAILALLLGSLTKHPVQYSALLFLFLCPVYAIEPLARVKRLFATSLVPDIILHISILLLVFLTLLLPSDSTIETSISYYVAISILLALACSFVFCKKHGVSALPIQPRLNEHKTAIKEGFPMYAGTLAYSACILLDRIFIESQFDEQTLSTYMLAFQITTFSTLILGSKNFISLIDHGESKASGKKQGNLMKNLVLTIFVAVALLALTTTTAYAAEFILGNQFKDLALFTLIIAIGQIAFFTAGQHTPILFFAKKQKQLTIFLTGSALIILTNNTIVTSYGLNAIMLPIVTSATLAIYAIFAISRTFAEFRETNT